MPDIDLMGATYPDVPAVTLPSGATTATFYHPDEIDYASSPSSGGNANRANAILYGAVDSTSTATVYTATVEGLTELVDGTTVMLHNGVVTSAAGFTVNVNGLGAKKCYNNMTNATQDTTIFNVNYTMLFVYSTTLDSGSGGWWIYRGYDGNTNTIGYQLRSNSGNLVASDTGYRYRLWLTSADGSKWVPINTSTSTDATRARTLNTRPIDPFGPIVYRATNGTCTAGTGIGATAIWQQYTLTIGYSYMASGFALTAQDSVYLRCTPQADGSAVMQDIVQTLPTSKDGKIYIHLGTAYSTTGMELTIEHAVYWHDGTGIRLWTGAESGGGSTVTVTQVQTSGTEIATVTIDGAATKLYAPEGGGGGADFSLVPVFLNRSSSLTTTVTIPEVGPDDMVTVFSSFGDIGGMITADYGAVNPYVVKNVNGAVTFKYRTATSYPLGVLLAVFSNLELQVFGLTSETVSNRKPEAGETVTVSGSGSFGTYAMYYNDLVTGESVLYATCADTSAFSGSFTMPAHPVYLTNSFSGGGDN